MGNSRTICTTRSPTSRTDSQFYARSDPATFRDERWKTELSDRQIRWFALAAGRLNRSLGYGAGRSD